jgi:hypothetical protein
MKGDKRNALTEEEKRYFVILGLLCVVCYWLFLSLNMLHVSALF